MPKYTHYEESVSYMQGKPFDFTQYFEQLYRALDILARILTVNSQFNVYMLHSSKFHACSID